jgi:hypothetical protein
MENVQNCDTYIIFPLSQTYFAACLNKFSRNLIITSQFILFQFHNSNFNLKSIGTRS